jgi:Uncharacterized protein conserved in bacteria
VSLDSVCYLDPRRKPAMFRLIESRMRRKELVPVELAGAGKLQHWLRPQTLDAGVDGAEDLVHILSPFDPLINQRKRLHLFFDYEHRFEAYVPKEKRLFGYFACPCWSETTSSRSSTSRPIASNRSCCCSAGPGWQELTAIAQETDRGRAAPVRTLPARALTRTGDGVA